MDETLAEILAMLRSMNEKLDAHITAEEPVLIALGEAESVRMRSAWVSAQIDRQNKRNQMMQKVIESSLSYILIAFIVFLGYSVWDHIVDIVRAKTIQ